MGEGKSRVGPVATVGSVALVAAAQTKPEEAISNIAGWLQCIGVDRVPPFLASAQTDEWVTAIGTAALLASLAWWWWERRRRKPATVDDWLRSGERQGGPSRNNQVLGQAFEDERAKQQAIIRAKAVMMTERLATRNCSMLEPGLNTKHDSYLAAMWNAEQRGEMLDGIHKSTFSLPPGQQEQEARRRAALEMRKLTGHRRPSRLGCALARG